MATNRVCPLCGGGARKMTFPYAIQFSDQLFRYYSCNDCRTVFVNPLPDQQCIEKMYQKTHYHDIHYQDISASVYSKSVDLLCLYASSGSSVLDYGCGYGVFLREARFQGFHPIGIEIDPSAISAASKLSGCPVFSLDEFERRYSDQRFDVIHLGDVLEHLPDPFSALSNLLQWLKPSGLLYVEGPLEINPSPVYFASRFFGGVMHYFRPERIALGVPTHLFRTSASAQSAFFSNRFPGLRAEYWRVFETGWPYAQGPWLKRRISDVAQLLGGRQFLGINFGNRFAAVYRLCN